MTQQQKRIRDMSHNDLVDSFENTVITMCRDMDRYARITKSTQKMYDDVRHEIMRRLESDD